jgi:signal-transduction protein with cAMP-binding, CBS, and nucleotidyltransferase domain
LQDQGHDALGLVEQCVEVTQKYGYNSKVMFSSVRHVEHVKNALSIGVHTITVPWRVMKALTENHFTEIGTQQFVAHTRMLTTKVREIAHTHDITISHHETIMEALVLMTRSKMGAVLALDETGQIHRIFTDGDLRRLMEQKQGAALQVKLSNLPANNPVTIDAEAPIHEASVAIKTAKVDSIVVLENGMPLGLVDVQDLL